MDKKKASTTVAGNTNRETEKKNTQIIESLYKYLDT